MHFSFRRAAALHWMPFILLAVLLVSHVGRLHFAAVSVPQYCGNGLREGAEQCDGDRDCGVGQHCNRDCFCNTTPACGNRVVEWGEDCDGTACMEGYQCDQSVCRCRNIQPPQCGNGRLETGEQCDYGHLCDSDQVCRDCACVDITPWCGDGILESGEACDFGVACPASYPHCGVPNSCECYSNNVCPFGRCQPPPPNSGWNTCGNGVFEPANGEQCEYKADVCPGPKDFCNTITCQCESPYISQYCWRHGDCRDDQLCYGGECKTAGVTVCGNRILESNATAYGEQCEANWQCNRGKDCSPQCRCTDPPTGQPGPSDVVIDDDLSSPSTIRFYGAYERKDEEAAFHGTAMEFQMSDLALTTGVAVRPGTYRISVRYLHAPTRSREVQYRLLHNPAGGSAVEELTAVVNQQEPPSGMYYGGMDWQVLWTLTETVNDTFSISVRKLPGSAMTAATGSFDALLVQRVDGVCGNGQLEGGEACDDNNRASGDGCTRECLIEIGRQCHGSPSVCSLACGYGGSCQSSSLPWQSCPAASVCTRMRTAGGSCQYIPENLNCFPVVSTGTCGDQTCVGTCFGCGSAASSANPYQQLMLQVVATPEIQYLFDPPISYSLPYWGSTFRITQFVWNRDTYGQFEMTESHQNWLKMTLTVPPHLPASSVVFDPDHSDPGCIVQGAAVLCKVPIIAPGDHGAIRVAYATTRPDPCVTVQSGPDEERVRVDFELVNHTTGESQTLPSSPMMPILQCNYCGDGRRNVYTGERCDDGNTLNGDGCSSTCRIEPGCQCVSRPYYSSANEAESVCGCCGDGIVISGVPVCSYVPTLDWGFPVGPSRWVCTSPGEECDDGNRMNGDGCSAHCKQEYCGDGIVNNGEQCDVGKRCDDAILCSQYACKMGEECVNGRCTNHHICSTDIECAVSACQARAVPGCTAGCRTQPGWICSGSPSACVFSTCGNGVLDDGEECDDGDNASGDGCSGICTVETHWACEGSPSVCRPWNACVDSDGGKNYTTYGNAAGAASSVNSLQTSQRIWDHCADSSRLVEAFCPSALGLPSTVTIPCPLGCAAGFCRSNAVFSSSSFSTSTSSIRSSSLSSVPASSRSSAASWGHCPSGFLCSATLTVAGVCETIVAPSCSLVIGGACGTTACPGVCFRCLASSSSSSSSSSRYASLSSSYSSPGGGASSSRSSSSALQASSAAAACGNRLIETGEQCDDGNLATGDGCAPTCLRDSGWICEGVPSVCGTLCGDGIRTGSEQCDDANAADGDGCSRLCRTEQGRASSSASLVIGMFSSSAQPLRPLCGNGLLEHPEQCDFNHPCAGGGFCMANCSCTPRSSSRGSAPSSATMAVAGIALCSNGVLEAGEQCEVGVTGCPSGYACHPSQCECVPLSALSSLSFSSPATASVCANGILETGEQCEVGLPCSTGQYCNFTCQCDVIPGAERSVSAVSSASLLPAAPDAVALLAASSSADASPVPSVISSAMPSPAPSICGDGVVGFGEACEQGHACPSGLFCMADCSCVSFTSSASLSGSSAQPPQPSPVCGNGLLETGEQCDDGNIMYGDGCSIFCVVERAAAPSSAGARPPASFSVSAQTSAFSTSSAGSAQPALSSSHSVGPAEEPDVTGMPWVWVGGMLLLALLLCAYLLWRIFRSRDA